MLVTCPKQTRLLTLIFDSNSFATLVGKHGVFASSFASSYSISSFKLCSPIKRRSHVNSWEASQNRGKVPSLDVDLQNSVSLVTNHASRKLERGLPEFDDDLGTERRTFKSVYELVPPEPRVSKVSKIRAFYQDLVETFPEVRSRQIKRYKHEVGFEVIMNVSPKDILLNMPVRTILYVLAPFPCCLLLTKWAILYLSVPSAQAVFAGVTFTFFIFYKYLSSICVIKQNPTTSTYAAMFPFRFLSREIRFRKSHVRSLSSESNFFSTCHVTIKGIRAFCPRSCFTTTHHYEELLRPKRARDMNNKL